MNPSKIIFFCCSQFLRIVVSKKKSCFQVPLSRMSGGEAPSFFFRIVKDVERYGSYCLCQKSCMTPSTSYLKKCGIPGYESHGWLLVSTVWVGCRGEDRGIGGVTLLLTENSTTEIGFGARDRGWEQDSVSLKSQTHSCVVWCVCKVPVQWRKDQTVNKHEMCRQHLCLSVPRSCSLDYTAQL